MASGKATRAGSRFGGWRKLTVWLLGYLSFMGTALAAPASVAFWYAEKPPVAELAQFDWVVLEPGHASAADVRALRDGGAQPFAYLSIGEFAGDAAALEKAGLSAGASPVANKAWGSQVMNLATPVWRAHLLERAAQLAKAGYTGLFLDTLDSFQLVAEDQRETQRLALKSLLAELHRRQPSLKLFFNRGFEVQPELPGVAAAMAVESIYAGWDAGKKTYRPVSAGDREWLKPRIEAALAKADLFVSIGTSGAVYPAAGFVRLASAYGAATLELNLERSEGSGWFDESRLGPASQLVPEWVEEMLSR